MEELPDKQNCRNCGSSVDGSLSRDWSNCPKCEHRLSVTLGFAYVPWHLSMWWRFKRKIGGFFENLKLKMIGWGIAIGFSLLRITEKETLKRALRKYKDGSE